jgi:hypothetical protein
MQPLPPQPQVQLQPAAPQPQQPLTLQMPLTQSAGGPVFTAAQAPQSVNDKRLDELQKHGVGQTITFGHQTLAPKVTHDDHVALEQALQNTQSTDVMKQQPENGELKLNRPTVDSFAAPGETPNPDFDEIYIDVRGRLHHRSEDEPVKTPESKKAE